MLKPEAEQALKPDREKGFKECADETGKDYCPEMIVVPAGSFIMGSPPTEKDSKEYERPQHFVTMAKPFAVSKFELTFDEWDTCVKYGECPDVPDSGWDRGKRPAINVTWEDAQRYAAWLSKVTGKPYRLLTEAEYEYAARAGTQTPYPWGSEIGKNNANCDGCGSDWDNSKTRQWPPSPPMVSVSMTWSATSGSGSRICTTTTITLHRGWDGSAWKEGGDGDCVVRGGSWQYTADELRSAHRNSFSLDTRTSNIGFRVGRTLDAP